MPGRVPSGEGAHLRVPVRGAPPGQYHSLHRYLQRGAQLATPSAAILHVVRHMHYVGQNCQTSLRPYLYNDGRGASAHHYTMAHDQVTDIDRRGPALHFIRHFSAMLYYPMRESPEGRHFTPSHVVSAP